MKKNIRVFGIKLGISPTDNIRPFDVELKDGAKSE